MSIGPFRYGPMYEIVRRKQSTSSQFGSIYNALAVQGGRHLLSPIRILTYASHINPGFINPFRDFLEARILAVHFPDS